MTDTLVELRGEPDGKLILRGYASAAERWYPVGGLFEERMNRVAWKRCLNEGPDTVLLSDHSGLGFARTKTPSVAPSLLLSEDRGGLRVEAFLDPAAPRVQDLRSSAENCGLQMSVGMRVTDDSWNADRSRREVRAASVHRGDVTVCNFGANEGSSATISSRGKAGEQERRAYADSLRGAAERRMCPVDEAYELRETATMTVAARPLPSSYSSLARAKAERARRGGTATSVRRVTATETAA